MEKQKNFLQFARNDKTILPIEEEFLYSVKKKIENKIGAPVSKWEKYQSHPIYDSFLMIVNNQPLLTKVNLSPDLPNFWKELSDNNFNFHPKVVCRSEQSDEFQFICHEIPKGIFFSDLSNYPLARKLNIQRTFLSTIDDLHKTKIATEDNTIKMIDSFLPRESMSIYKTYPIVSLFSIVKLLFKKLYISNNEHLGLCHFDLSHENIIYTGQAYSKLINLISCPV